MISCDATVMVDTIYMDMWMYILIHEYACWTFRETSKKELCLKSVVLNLPGSHMSTHYYLHFKLSFLNCSWSLDKLSPYDFPSEVVCSETNIYTINSSVFIHLYTIKVEFHNHLIRLKFYPNYFMHHYTYFRQIYQEC